VGCFAHARRHLYESLSSNLPAVAPALGYVGLLYRIERKGRGWSAAERLELRQRCAVPVLAELKAFLERTRISVLPKSPEGKAVAYALNNWEALSRYAGDGDLAIDNNGAERSLRGVAVGRRNWTFFGSDNGGKTAAVLKSFIASCQRAKVEPWAYFKDVLGRIASHPVQALDELLPANWKPAAA
jgi:transposase